MLAAAAVTLVDRAQHGRSTRDESGVVTVVGLRDVVSGRNQHSFTNRVRLASGAEAMMTFGEAFTPGTRVWVSYRRDLRSDHVHVKAYARRGASSVD